MTWTVEVVAEGVRVTTVVTGGSWIEVVSVVGGSVIVSSTVDSGSWLESIADTRVVIVMVMSSPTAEGVMVAHGADEAVTVAVVVVTGAVTWTVDVCG